MKLEILSPEGAIYKGEVNLVTFPGTSGQFTVLKDHASLISSLEEGDIILHEEGKEGEEEVEKKIPVKGGFVEIHKNEISVCIK